MYKHLSVPNYIFLSSFAKVQNFYIPNNKSCKKNYWIKYSLKNMGMLFHLFIVRILSESIYDEEEIGI